MKLSQKLIIAAALIFLLISAIALLKGNRSSLPLVGNQAVSPDILYLTLPVNSFSGKVEKVEGNKIVVSQQITPQQSFTLSAQTSPGQPPSAIPTPQTKTLTYKVTVGKNTQINRLSTLVNYLFKTVTPAPSQKLDINTIKVGQYVMVNSTVDLRTLSSNEFEATSIQLSANINTLNGKISDLKDAVIKIKAFAPMTSQTGTTNSSVATPQEKEYSVTVTGDTEISRSAPSADIMKPSTPEKLSLSDLKKDMQVTVYTVGDVTTDQKLTALRIELMIVAAPPAISSVPTAPIQASPSAKPSF